MQKAKLMEAHKTRAMKEFEGQLQRRVQLSEIKEQNSN